MRILDLAHLPRSLVPQIAAFGPLDGDFPQDARFIRRFRRLGLTTSDYFAVYAVEGEQVLAKVETFLPIFRSGDRSYPVVGLADVATRPDALGRGLATALIGEVHRRESRAGRRWSFLWTHVSWQAHRLYERLGYVDVYSPPVALRHLPRGRVSRIPAGYRWRPAVRTDFRNIAQVLRRGSEGRVGFSRHGVAFRKARVDLGWWKLKELWLLFREGRAVGYAHLSDSPTGKTADEVLLTSPDHSAAMLTALERTAQGRWLTFASTTFVRDVAPLLTTRGYGIHSASHRTLMVRDLAAPAPGDRNPPPLVTCRDPKFSCHRADQF
ncbi:MAG: GNAT family N-acetyltransferase [Thermoplasmata archaeon]|nr:GNAT family N-acetyltransferase [Thermoplasmata archaeon]